MECEADPYRLWEVVGTWIASIGTVSAVIVTLWLVVRQERPRLRVYAGKRVLIYQGASSRPDMLYLEVTNLGMNPVRITAIGYFWKFLRASGLHQMPPGIGNKSHDLPAVLQHGETLQWTLPYQESIETIAKLALAPSRYWRLKLRLLRLHVNTSLRTAAQGPFEKMVRDDLAREIVRLRGEAE